MLLIVAVTTSAATSQWGDASVTETGDYACDVRPTIPLASASAPQATKALSSTRSASAPMLGAGLRSNGALSLGSAPRMSSSSVTLVVDTPLELSFTACDEEGLRVAHSLPSLRSGEVADVGPGAFGVELVDHATVRRH